MPTMMRCALLWSSLLGTTLGGGTASANPGDAFELAIVPVTSGSSQVLIRTDIATGASALCAASTCLVIPDATPPGSGSYHVYATSQMEASGRSWAAVRFDGKSGRMWGLNYDGKTTASWTLYTVP